LERERAAEQAGNAPADELPEIAPAQPSE